jgi:hypothetical protein
MGENNVGVDENVGVVVVNPQVCFPEKDILFAITHMQVNSRGTPQILKEEESISEQGSFHNSSSTYKPSHSHDTNTNDRSCYFFGTRVLMLIQADSEPRPKFIWLCEEQIMEWNNLDKTITHKICICTKMKDVSSQLSMER